MTQLSQKMRYRLLDYSIFFSFIIIIIYFSQHQAVTAGDILFLFCLMELENKGGR